MIQVIDLLVALGKLDDQDRVLGGQPDQHDQPDLGQDVVVASHEIHAQDGGEQAHGDDQDDRQRHHQALIVRREQQEDKEHGEREDHRRRVPGAFLLERELRPLIRESLRQ